MGQPNYSENEVPVEKTDTAVPVKPEDQATPDPTKVSEPK